MADHDSHDAASHAFLEDAESVAMQLIELSERVRERHRQIQELMADQEMDQQRERKLLSMLDGHISEGRHRHLQDQRAWKSEVERVADRVQADWAARAAAAEREIEHQKARHQQEVAKLHHSLQEAVSSARKLEARLDSQQTAASVVMHAAAQDSLMQRRVASITHNRQHLDRSRASLEDSASAPGGRHQTRQQQQEQHHPHAASGVLSDVGSTSAESIRVDEALYTKFREVDRKAYEYKKDLHKERETNHRLAAEVDSLRQELALASKDHTPVRQHQQQHPAAPAVTGTGGAHSQHTQQHHQQRSALSETASTSAESRRLDMYDGGGESEVRRTPPRPSALAGGRRVLDAPTPGGDTPTPPPSRTRASVQVQQHGAGINVSASESTIAGDSRAQTAANSPERGGGSGGGGGANAGKITLGLVLGMRRQNAHQLGIEVTEVTKSSPADVAGIRPRSLLVELNGRQLLSSRDVADTLHQIKQAFLDQRARGEPLPTNVLIPFQCLNLPRVRSHPDALDASATISEVDLEGRRISWEGRMTVDLSELAVGPFNHRRQHYVGSPTELAPIMEVMDLEAKP
jgi:hypothetical protein